ncbi:MAG: tellurite resistance TerB family protein [Rhodospirillales bacterium]|nr:tellurite resistance TerB family protein [Rhodospirillales bacterium]
MISHHAALIYTMVLVSAADRRMPDSELQKIGEIIRTLPVFADYNRELVMQTAAACAELLNDDDGLDEAFAQIEAALPTRLRETAYALACDVAAADQEVPEEEARMLEMIRHRLKIDRLIAAAIERGARARFSVA